MMNLIFISDEWGYTKGGINTINVDLCKSIAKSNDVKVYCIVIYADKNVIESARGYNVNIITLNDTRTDKNKFQKDDINKLIKNSEIKHITNCETWIIGHDVITGDTAINLCCALKKDSNKNVKSAIIHHMDYEDYLVNKESYDSNRIIEQRNLLIKSDLLFGVGPRLKRSACNIKRSDNCPQIIPGISFEDAEINEYCCDIKQIRVLVCGRIGQRDDIIKNAKLSAKAFATLVGNNDISQDARISLIGCDEKQREELISLGSSYAGRIVTINPYGFLNREELMKQMASYHICIMPSLKEGFGLTGWEAISLGIPVIISKSSGLYEFLEDPEYIGYITVIDIKGGEINEEEDIRELADAIKKIYNNYNDYKNRALKLRNKLIYNGIVWNNTARHFIENLNCYKCDQDKIKYSPQPTIQFYSDVFTDRESVIEDIFNLMESGKQVINIYGKKGIGKSSILKFLSDGINNILSEANRNKKFYFDNHLKLIQNLSVNYIELSTQKSLRRALIDYYSIETSSLGEIVYELGNNIDKRKLLLIFDNANNESLFEEIMEFIDMALSINFNCCIIIGSIKKCPLYKLSTNYHQIIDIKPFDENDIEQYAVNNNINTDKLTLCNIKNISKGLPIYVKLLLKQTTNYNGYQEYGDMEKYIHSILFEIRNIDENKLNLIIYIALLNIIYDSNNGVPVEEIYRYFDISNIDEVLDTLEHNYSIIEHHRDNSSVRMHDIIRDIIVKFELSNNTDKIREIINSFEEHDYQKKAYYILLLDKKYQSNTYDNNKVIETIDKAVKNEDYLFLLSFGDFFMNLHFLKDYDINNCKDLYISIIWGIIEAYIGVGNYPLGMSVIRKCKTTPSVRSDNNSELHLKLLLTFANLKHLMNNYSEAIEDYRIILDSIDKYPNHENYKSVCYWGIAHSQKHIGKNIKEAIRNYDNAIIHGKDNLIYKLKSERERIISYFAISEIDKGKLLLDILNDELNDLPEDEYKDIRISVDRCWVLYELLENRLNEESLNALERARISYKKIGKRLEYDTLFEIGECYRKMKNYQKASQKYREAKELSIKNKDHNLETMCSLAIVLCNILKGNCIKNSKVIANYKKKLVNIIVNCKKYSLYRNELFAQTILDFLMSRSVEPKTIAAFRAIDMKREASLFATLDIKTLENINFILM